MRKRRNHAVVLSVMLAGIAQAAWWNPIGDKFSAGNQCLSGAVERLTVVAGPSAWTNYATTNIFADHFNTFVKCRIAKQMLAAAVDSGAYTMPETNWTPDTAVTLDRTNLAARIGVGLDWWTNTPALNVMTATNGFRFLTNALSHVVWTREPCRYYPKPVSSAEDLCPMTNIFPRYTWAGTYGGHEYNGSLKYTALDADGYTEIAPFLNARGSSDFPDNETVHSLADAQYIVDFLLTNKVFCPGPNGEYYDMWPSNRYVRPMGLWTLEHGPIAVAARPTLQWGVARKSVISVTTNYVYGDEVVSETFIVTNYVYNSEPYTYQEPTFTPTGSYQGWATTRTTNAVPYWSFDGSRYVGLSGWRTNYTIVEGSNWETIVTGDTTYNDVEGFSYGWREEGYNQPTYNVVATNEGAVTNIVATWYTAYKTQVSSCPVVGSVVSNGYAGLGIMMYTGIAHAVDFWLKFEPPFSPFANNTIADGPAYWSEYALWASGGSAANVEYTTNYALYAGDGGSSTIPSSPGWTLIGSSPENNEPIACGPVVGVENDLDYVVNSCPWSSVPTYSVFEWSSSVGWDVRTNTAVVKWDLKWFK